MKELKETNIHERDNRINFDEENHIYTIDDNKKAKSVTQLISEFFPKFDKNYWANNESKKTGEKVEDILKRWADLGDKARNEGTNLHNQIENFYNKNHELEDQFLNKLIKKRLIKQFNHEGFFFNIDKKTDPKPVGVKKT